VLEILGNFARYQQNTTFSLVSEEDLKRCVNHFSAKSLIFSLCLWILNVVFVLRLYPFTPLSISFRYREVWMKFDPAGTGRLSLEQVPKFLDVGAFLF
jgi:hypothetical protein